jgi:putative ATP-dependent endonuclease of OLD family
VVDRTTRSGDVLVPQVPTRQGILVLPGVRAGLCCSGLRSRRLQVQLLSGILEKQGFGEACNSGRTKPKPKPKPNPNPNKPPQLHRGGFALHTHSNVFLDTRSDVSVHHVGYDGTKSTVTSLETPARSRDVLADMGYKASDLLQANCVIWVEGPSDRIYLNKWLSLVVPDLVEGIHYAVTFYGGRILAHFTANDDPVEDLVQVLRINRHAIMVMDRDGDDETVRLNANKQHIQTELEDDACWVSQGREVENYLPLALIRRTLVADCPEVARVEFGLNDHLAEVLEEMNGGPGRYDKVAFARRFCAQMTNADVDVLDLRGRLDAIVQLIRGWNHAEAAAG